MRGVRRIAVVAALTSALALVGCSSRPAAAPPQASGAPAEQTGTLRVLVANFPSDTEGEGVFDDIVARFHREYPKLRVQGDFVPYDGLNQKISTSLISGQGYDVISAGVGWIQPLADLGAIRDMTSLGVTPAQLAKSAQPALVPPALVKGRVYGIPVVANPRVLALSRSAFEKAGLDPDDPPSSLAELRADAKKLTIRDASGRLKQTGFDFWAAPSNYRQQWVAFMGALGGKEFRGEEPAFDSAAGRKALQTIHDMVQVDRSSIYGYQNAAQTALVTTGAAAMGYASPYQDCSAKTGIGDKCDDLEYFTLKDRVSTEYVGGRLVSIGADTHHARAGLALARAFQAPASQQAISKLDVGVPVDPAAADSEFVTSNAAARRAVADLKYSVLEYGGANYLNFRADLGPALDEVILGRRSAADALRQLANDARHTR